MKAIITPAGVFGPFQYVETLNDRYRADGTDYPFTVIGTGNIVEADTIQWPVSKPDVAEKRAEIWTEIKTIRDTKIQTGGYQASGKWFHSDTFSRTQQMALVMMGASVPAIKWKTMDGSFVTMTQGLAGAIFQAAAAHDAAIFGHAEALRAQVDAASDPSTIDIHAGWPATFVASPESPA